MSETYHDNIVTVVVEEAASDTYNSTNDIKVVVEEAVSDSHNSINNDFPQMTSDTVTGKYTSCLSRVLQRDIGQYNPKTNGVL